MYNSDTFASILVVAIYHQVKCFFFFFFFLFFRRQGFRMITFDRQAPEF